MPVYNYKALKDDGGSDAGVIDADSPKDARLKLKNRRLHVTDLQTLGGEEKGGNGAARKRRFKFFARKRPDQVAMLTRQLATLLGSGIPMIGAITALIDQVEYRDLKAAVFHLVDERRDGADHRDARPQKRGQLAGEHRDLVGPLPREELEAALPGRAVAALLLAPERLKVGDVEPPILQLETGVLGRIGVDDSGIGAAVVL